MGSIDSRLRRLTERWGAAHRCPECSHAPDERRPIAAVYPDDPGRGYEGDPDERCECCGRPLWTVVRVVYGGDEGGG